MGQIQPSCDWERNEIVNALVLTDENNEAMQTMQDTMIVGTNPDGSVAVIPLKPTDARSNEKITINKVRDTGIKDQGSLFQDDNVLDVIHLSDLDLQNSKSVESRRTLAKKKKKKKRRSWLPWKKRKEAKEFVTTGVTVRLNANHNMVLYRPTEQHSKGYLSLQNERKGRRSFNHGLEKPCQISDFASAKTKLVMKDVAEMRSMVSMHLKGRRDSNIDSSIVCGDQIFATRYNDTDNFNNAPRESAPQSRAAAVSTGGYTPRPTLRGMNVLKPTILDEKRLHELLSICREKLNINENYTNSTRPESSPRTKQIVHKEKQNNAPLSRNFRDLSNVLSAVVPPGIGIELYTPEIVQNTNIGSVEEMICIDEANEIYVCDIGLSPEQCDFIVDTTERCSRGNYAAYTYAKQTLGCRDHDDLATLCEWPVIRAYSSIMKHLEEEVMPKNGTSKRNLVLDEREPHLVKYDTSKKERQKLDMHTDKSEWTIIIALSDGNGADYHGGGTYLECINSTIHLQKGHALIFPGKRRHRGQKIIDGIRFLLVGFLVEKEELDAKKERSKIMAGTSDFDFVGAF